MVAGATTAYVWEDPGDSIMVQITLDVVERLGEVVQQSLGTGPRGAEIGGILLGRSLTDGGRTVQIEDFELVPCQHLRGASYTLAPKDREVLGAQLSRRRTTQIVGYFRSHTRPGLYLDQEDFAILSRYFPDPAQVFLIVRPSTDGSPTGGFFFWEEGDINRRAPYREFPFDREQLGAGGFSITDRLAVAPGETPRGTKPAVRPPVTMAFRLPHVPWLAVPVIGGLFLLAGLFVSQKDTPKSAPAPAQPAAPRQQALALGTEKIGDTVHLRWDPNAPAIQKADLGILWVTDGTERKRLELSQQDLATGTTIYTPTSKNVDFELQVFTLSDRTNKAVQLTTPEPPAIGEVAQSPVPQPGAPQTPGVPATAQTPGAIPLPGTPVKPRVKKQPATRNSFTPPPSTSVPASPVDVPPPPSLTASGEKSQGKLIGVLPPHTVSLPAAPEASVTFEPAHGSTLKRVFHKISRAGEGESADGFVAAQPIHKVSPTVPTNGEPLEDSIDVKVFIDEAGYVSRAQLLTKKSDSATASLVAARQWRFTPARKHDKPVTSEMVLHFHF